MEQWKDIPGCEGRYQASTYGRIRSCVNRWKSFDRILHGTLRADGYLQVTLLGKTYLIHRIVGLTWIPPVKSKKHINHKNGNKQDNRIVNLEWTAPVENTDHAIRLGLRPIRKLSPEQVNAIRSRALAGENQREIAKEFKISRPIVSQIKNNLKHKIKA